MNLTMLGLELRRVFRDRTRLFFSAVLPAFFYVIFGAVQDYSEIKVGNGNVAMAVMVAMAAYGAVTATTTVGGTAAIERAQGWGRQLGLTPLADTTYVATKATLAAVVAVIPIGLIYLIGALTKAEGTAQAWVLSAVVLVLGSVVFSLYGLCFGLALRSEAALGAASGSVVLLGFLGNLFFPLSGWMLDVARLTPLYGYAALARYPVTKGWIASPTDAPVHEALWIPVTNLIVWTALLAAIAVLLVRRGRGRQ